MSRRNKKPIFQDLPITDAGAKGKAVAKAPDGRVVFVSNAVPGDVATVETYKKRRNYYEGTATSFSHYSEDRVDPPCAYFGLCGGCKWQFMDYQAQLRYKNQEVIQNLIRIGKLELPEVDPIVGAEEIYYYRNKMEFSFSKHKWLTKDQVDEGKPIDRRALGFHRPGMWDKVIDIEHCHLQAEPSNTIRNFIRDYAKKHDLEFFDPKERVGLLRTLMIRTSSTGDVMVLLQFFEPRMESIDLLLDSIRANFPQLTSLLYVINPKANDSIYDQEIFLHSGREYIEEKMEGLTFRINAKSFYQTNSSQAHRLYQLTREFAGLTGIERVYDLYTGTGTIAQFISAKAKEVIGVESVPEAIEAARENAAINGIDNVSFVVGDMRKVFTDDFVRKHGHPDVVITDPPRDGMHKDVVDQLLKLRPERIVYVSCNSATQARDLQLMAGVYRVERVQPVDMFPQTAHVENIVLLTLDADED